MPCCTFVAPGDLNFAVDTPLARRDNGSSIAAFANCTEATIARMSPNEFLLARVPGYAELNNDDHRAIQEFVMLWSAFEGTILGTEGGTSALIKIGSTMRDHGQLDMTRFGATSAYFRNRYWQDGGFTPEFDGLHVERYNSKNRDLVSKTIDGTQLPPEDVVCGLLLIVFRLRNNLFHGVKWAYGIRDQQENFRNACEILMAVMDLYPMRR